MNKPAKAAPTCAVVAGSMLITSGLLASVPALADVGQNARPANLYATASGLSQAPETLPKPGDTGTLTVVKAIDGAARAATFEAIRVVSVSGVPLSLSSYGGWNLLTALGVFADNPTAASNFEKTQASVQKLKEIGAFDTEHKITADSNAQGQVVFNNLPVGLYLVQEVGERYPKAEPIMVTLPYPNPETGQWLLTPPPIMPKVNDAGLTHGYDAALRIWAQRVYEPVTDGGWAEVWNFDTAASSAAVPRDADGAPLGPTPYVEVQVGDAIQYELQLHNQGTETIRIDEITFHSVPGLVLASDEIHPGQQNHVWVPLHETKTLPEEWQHSHTYQVEEDNENLILQPGEYHQLAFTAIVTDEISTDSRFAHWDSEDGVFDIFAEISGISGWDPLVRHQDPRHEHILLRGAMGRSAATRLFGDLAIEWIPVTDVDSDHHVTNWFDQNTYLDNVIHEDQKNKGGDKDNHDGDHARLVEHRTPQPTLPPEPPEPGVTPTPPAGGGEELLETGPSVPAAPGKTGTETGPGAGVTSAERAQAASRAQAARRSQMARTGVQILAIVAGATMVFAGLAAMRRRKEQAS